MVLLLLHFNLQIYATGRLVVFTKNCLEVCVKVVLFKKFKIGLEADAQIAMFSNLLAYFDM